MVAVLGKTLQHYRSIHVIVYWDAERPIHIGLGRSVVFIRGLVLLKVNKSIDICGSYAKHWPRYIEKKMGLRPSI